MLLKIWPRLSGESGWLFRNVWGINSKPSFEGITLALKQSNHENKKEVWAIISTYCCLESVEQLYLEREGGKDGLEYMHNRVKKSTSGPSCTKNEAYHTMQTWSACQWPPLCRPKSPSPISQGCDKPLRPRFLK